MKLTNVSGIAEVTQGLDRPRREPYQRLAEAMSQAGQDHFGQLGYILETLS
jgi:hypothetical protein